MIRQNQGFLTKLYMLTDFAFIQLAFLLAWWVKFESGWFPMKSRYLSKPMLCGVWCTERLRWLSAS